MRISHRGLFTGGGVPCSLATAIKGTINSPATYQHLNKMVARTINQGEVDFINGDDAAGVLFGVIIDVSPKGDSATVETKGFEWVRSAAGIAVGDLVTSSNAGDGTLGPVTAPGAATLGELVVGVWQVDEVDMTAGAERVLICLDARL